jgi:hypothetical protein
MKTLSVFSLSSRRLPSASAGDFFLKLNQTLQNRNSLTLYTISLLTFLLYSGYFMNFQLSNKKINKIVVASPKSSSKKINGEDCTNG